jgi:threonine/homoserine/homoserine lactone efflux protein
MPTLATLISFTMVARVMVFTPGAAMIYYVSRSICQGHAAGLIYLAGGISATLIYMLCASFDITTLISAVPHDYDILRMAGVAYLLYIS